MEGNVDPIRDLDIIKTELILKDLDRINKTIVDLERKAREQKDKEMNDEIDVLKKAKELLDNGKKVIEGEWTVDDIYFLNKHLFLTSKSSV